jgi:hypothetical protein
MATATALGIAGDLAVTTFVVSQNVPDRCDFSTGLVFNISDANSLRFENPPPNGAPFYYLMQAQLTSLGNGGSQGIYKKVNNDTKFRADTNDLLGTWSCTQEADIGYPPKTPLPQIIGDLNRTGLIFGDNLVWAETQIVNETYQATGLFTHALILTATGIGFGEAFDFKAALQVEVSMDQNITMRPMKCSLAAPLAAVAAYSLNSSATMNKWSPNMEGMFYYGADTVLSLDADKIMERLLNTMTMIQGGNDYLLATAPANDPKYGCLKPRTNIPDGILALIGIELVFCLLLVLSYIFDWFRLRSMDPTRRKLADRLPYGQTSWIVHAVRERIRGRRTGDDVDEIKKKGLRTWDLVEEDDEIFPRLGKAVSPVGTSTESRMLAVSPESRPILSVPPGPSLSVTPLSRRTSTLNGFETAQPAHGSTVSPMGSPMVEQHNPVNS